MPTDKEEKIQFVKNDIFSLIDIAKKVKKDETMTKPTDKEEEMIDKFLEKGLKCPDCKREEVKCIEQYYLMNELPKLLSKANKALKDEVKEMKKQLKNRPTIKKFKETARKMYGDLVKNNIDLKNIYYN